MDQIIHLHRVFKRKLLRDIVGEAADDQGSRVLLGDTAGHQIEDGVIADTADLCLVSDIGVLRADIHRRDGVGTGDIVEHQGLAGDSGFAALCLRGYDNGAPEGADSAVLGDRSRIYIGRSFRSVVNDLTPGIEVLSLTGECDSGELGSCALAVQHAHRVEVRNMGTEGTGYPLDDSAFLDLRPFCV